MPGWEYIRVNRVREIKAGFLGAEAVSWNREIFENDLGRQGWELVSVVPYASKAESKQSLGLTTEEMWVFKRPLP